MSHTASTTSHTAHAGAHAHGAGATHGAGTSNDGVLTEDGRALSDPTHDADLGHGNTPGGWLMAGLVMVGFAAGCIGLLTDANIVVWIGVALMVLGALAGFVSSKAESRESAHHTGAGRGHADGRAEH